MLFGCLDHITRFVILTLVLDGPFEFYLFHLMFPPIQRIPPCGGISLSHAAHTPDAAQTNQRLCAQAFMPEAGTTTGCGIPGGVTKLAMLPGWPSRSNSHNVRAVHAVGPAPLREMKAINRENKLREK